MCEYVAIKYQVMKCAYDICYTTFTLVTSGPTFPLNRDRTGTEALFTLAFNVVTMRVELDRRS